MTAMEERGRPVKRVFDALSKMDVAATREHVSSELFAHVEKHAGHLREAFPDLQLTVEDVITEGDKVVTRWTAHGTHRGPGVLPGYGRVKPTGKRMTVHGITVHRVENDKIVQTWGVTDKLEAMMQLGLVTAGSDDEG